MRSQTVLLCRDGLDNKRVAEQAGCSTKTVSKWRARFVLERLGALVDEPRPGCPTTITTEPIKEVVVGTLESTPKNVPHWSRAKMAEPRGLSKATIGRNRKTTAVPSSTLPRCGERQCNSDYLGQIVC